MAWPSSNKASTGNVDSGSDQPSQARADIKQNIDNVNTIIDTFNISSPSDGDLLQYSSSTGQWEQVASSSVGGGGDFAIVEKTTSYVSLGGGNYAYSWGSDFDPNSIYTIGTGVENYKLNLGAGNYIFEIDGLGDDNYLASLTLYNETSSSSISSLEWIEIGTVGDTTITKPYGFTLASSSDISIRGPVGANWSFFIKITKF